MTAARCWLYRPGAVLMELMRATFDAMGGVLGDQWKDFNTVPGGPRPTAALFADVQRGTDTGLSANVAQWTISPGISNRDRTGRAHPFGEPGAASSVDVQAQTGESKRE